MPEPSDQPDPDPPVGSRHSYDPPGRREALCVWRVHDDGTRSLMATPVDAEFADRLVARLQARGMHVEIVEQPPPYSHTGNERLWDGPLTHPVVEARLDRYASKLFDRRSSASLALDWLPTDELLRIIRQHAEAGAPDDDLLAVLQEVVRLRAREEACRQHSDEQGSALSMVAACLYRADPNLCRRALELNGFTLHDLFALDHMDGGLDDEWIDELIEEARDG